MHNCIIIPIYNHHETISATVNTLQQFKLPIVIVDDGSDQQTKDTLFRLTQQYPVLHLVTLPVNTGKGGAVIAGMRWAYQQGFTHALQVDADGQHNLHDIPELWRLSAAYPHALISGKPVYDDSMPLSRRIGRQITHFWVWIETLSFNIKDSMCGFRIYPLKSCIALLQQTSLGQRMDFDTEIMVRLYWRAVPILFVTTKVIYPPGGKSHFNAFHDNWLITKMHTRLFFSMLWQLPKLLNPAWRKKHEQIS